MMGRPLTKPQSRALGARLHADEPEAAQAVARALEAADGHHGAAARALNVSLSTLYRWLDLPVFKGMRLNRLGVGMRPTRTE